MSRPKDKNIMSALYGEAFKYQRRYKITSFLGFVISSIISIVSISKLSFLDDPNFIMGVILISILLIYLSYRNRQRFKYTHSQAERIRKKEFVKEVLNSSINHEEDSYIYYDINEETREKARKIEEENKQNKISENGYYTVLASFEGRVLESIQQNCNQTAINLITYYKFLGKKVVPLFIIVMIFLVLLIIYLLINLESELIKISKILIAFIAIFFSIDFYSYYKSFKSESEALRRLDIQIGRIKVNSNIFDLLYYFSEYNSILENKPNEPYRIHRENKIYFRCLIQTFSFL